MCSSCVLEVDLVNCSDTHPASIEFYSFVTRLAGSFIVHKHTPKHLYLFTYPDFKIPDNSEESEYSSTWLYKDRNTLVTIPKHCLSSLDKALKQQYENMVRRKPRFLYDAESGTFKPYNQKVHVSNTIQPIDVTVNLKETKDGNTNVKVNKNRYPGLAVKYQEIFLTKSHVSSSSSHSHHRQEVGFVAPGYECTDGPEENVVFHISSSIKDNLSDVEVAQSSPIPYATLDSAVARGPSRRERLSCRHPDYDEEEARVQSFWAWPLQHDVQDVNNLAANGFFYTGRFDLVRCYQCGLGLKDWSFQEDPLIEHVRYSPHCLHLAETVEPARLQQLQFFNIPTDRATVNPQASGQAPGGPRLRHPEYQSLEARVNSYRNWPRDLLQTPELLSEAGFYYTGFQDQVRCYCCDGGLQHWDADDDPWIEHARWFSHCHHVTMVKGDNYVRMVQMALASSDDEEDLAVDELITEDLSKGASGAGLVSDDPIYSQAAQAVVTQFGFSTAAVRMALRECTDKGVRWDKEKLVNILLDKQQRGEVLPDDSPRSVSPASPEVDVSTDAGLRAEYSKLRHRLMCLLCETKAADVLFLPCAHHKMCSHCACDVTMCPVCEKQVKEKVKTFMV